MIRWAIGIALALGVAYVGLMVGASELAEEVIVLRKPDFR